MCSLPTALTAPATPEMLFNCQRRSPQMALAAARETKALEIGSGCLTHAAEMFRQNFPGREAVPVADTTTMAVAGESVIEIFRSAGIPLREPFVYTDPALYAEYKYVEQLFASLKTHDAIPIAIGSGSINDLTKRASHECNRPYMCIATAASMDGYTAFGASITYQNAKQTLACPAPRAVLADVEIIRHAPQKMTASGYADLLAKVTAGADWILADALGEEPIDVDTSWAIVQGGLKDALANPKETAAGNPAAIQALTEGLMLGGFAMQASQSSRPASGAEHQFSHLWDMEHHTHEGSAPSHGFKVGVATLAISAFYEQLLNMDAVGLDIDGICARWPARETVESETAAMFASTDFQETAVRETLHKYVDARALREQLNRLRDDWTNIREKLRRQLLPCEEVKRRLEEIGAPVEPEQIGITRQRLRSSFKRAYHIRRRFTVLDLATRTAWFEPLLDRLFGKGGRWEIKD